MSPEEQNEQESFTFARKLLSLYLEDHDMKKLTQYLKAYQNLRIKLSMRERQLANLTKNIPGGVHQCANDAAMTILSMSDGFLSMFGYNEADIERLFEGKFINMIYLRDRSVVLEAVREQLEKGTDLELEYRVINSSGQPVWVLDKGRLIDDDNGGQCFYCVLIDITQRKQQEEELRLSLERHKVISDQATDIIFEWDMRKDTLEFSPNWNKRFGYEALSQNVSKWLLLSKNVHPEDLSALSELMRNIGSGADYCETECRIRSLTNEHFWCRIRATTQYDSEGCPIKVIGVIVDIDAERRQKQELILKTQLDGLTDIYNKETIDLLVEQQLQIRRNLKKDPAHSYHALLIVDVDHFKDVNDCYGHLRGDSVLSNVASAIKSSVQESNLIGRVGGDEFLVYLPEVANEESVRHTAQRILQALEPTRIEPKTPHITCSIGIAILPHCCCSYQKLYQSADDALYQCKRNGRNGFSLFNPTSYDSSNRCHTASAQA